MQVLKPRLYDTETRFRALNAVLDKGSEPLWVDCAQILHSLSRFWLDRLLRLRIEHRYALHGSERLATVLRYCSDDAYCAVAAHLSYAAMERLWSVLQPAAGTAQRALADLALRQGPELDAKTLFLARVAPEVDPFAVVIGACSPCTLRILLDAGRLPTDRHLLDAAIGGQFWLFVWYAPADSFTPWLLRVTRQLLPGPVPEFLAAVTAHFLNRQSTTLTSTTV